MYDILSNKCILEIESSRYSYIEPIINKLLYSTNNGKIWSAEIRDIIKHQENIDKYINLEIFKYLLSIQKYNFSQNIGNKTDTEYLIEDFEYSSAVWIGDGKLPSSIVSIFDRGYNHDFQRFMYEYISQYV